MGVRAKILEWWMRFLMGPERLCIEICTDDKRVK